MVCSIAFDYFTGACCHKFWNFWRHTSGSLLSNLKKARVETFVEDISVKQLPEVPWNKGIRSWRPGVSQMINFGSSYWRSPCGWPWHGRLFQQWKKLNHQVIWWPFSQTNARAWLEGGLLTRTICFWCTVFLTVTYNLAVFEIITRPRKAVS